MFKKRVYVSKNNGIFKFLGVFDVVFATKICKDYNKDAAKTAQRWPD